METKKNISGLLIISLLFYTFGCKTIGVINEEDSFIDYSPVRSAELMDGRIIEFQSGGYFVTEEILRTIDTTDTGSIGSLISHLNNSRELADANIVSDSVQYFLAGVGTNGIPEIHKYSDIKSINAEKTDAGKTILAVVGVISVIAVLLVIWNPKFEFEDKSGKPDYAK